MANTDCRLCPRRCGVARDISPGFCGVGTQPRIARAALHFWEEPCLGGDRGVGAVFFSGCNLGCVYCQNRKISLDRFGRQVTVPQLRDLYFRLIEQGCRCIDLVTPTHFLPAVAESLRPALPVPVIYNCGGYECAESLRLLEGLVDIYLPDLKYMEPETAARYSAAPDYPQTALAALDEMYRQTGDCVFDDQGLLLRGTLVRHLILPGCVQNSLKCIDAFAAFARGKQVLFSLMSQYTPSAPPANFPELGRSITPEEYDAVKLWLFCSGIQDGYLQDPDSADPAFVPDFDLSGL